jgi:hypothetical protein
VETKAGSLIEISEASAFRIAVETQIPSAKRPRVIDSPSKQRGRDTSSGEVPPHREAMDERGIVGGEIGPEEVIVELELQHSRDFAVTLGDTEEASFDF